MPPTFPELDHAEQVRRLRRLATSALTAYGPDAVLGGLLQYERNAVFAVDAGQRRFALRIGPADGPARPALEAELDWLLALGRDTALRVPAPIANLRGDMITTIADDDVPAARHVVLLGWVPGSAQRAELSAAVARRMGAAAAGLHRHASGLRPEVGRARQAWGPHRLAVDRAVLAGASMDDADRAILDGAIERADRDLAALGAAPGRWMLIHGDLHLDNLLVDDDGAVGVIDFDDCGHGHDSYDLACLLDAIRRRVASDDAEYQVLRGAVLEGYGAVRALSPALDDELATFRALREIATLAFVLGTSNAEVQTWGPGRCGEALRGLAAYLDDRGGL